MTQTTLGAIGIAVNGLAGLAMYCGAWALCAGREGVGTLLVGFGGAILVMTGGALGELAKGKAN